MLKTTKSTRSRANHKEIKGKVGGKSVNGNNIVGGGEAINPIKGNNHSKMTKSKILVKSKNHHFPFKSRIKEAKIGFFTPKARLAFTQLRQIFVKASILYHFNAESYIRIKTNVLGYAIGGVTSQLSSKTRPDVIVTKTHLVQCAY